VETLSPASTERVDACKNRCIRLLGVQPAEAEKIVLMAAILGWEIEAPGAADRSYGRLRSWVGAFPEAFGSVDPVEPWKVPERVAAQSTVANVELVDAAGWHGNWAPSDPGSDSGDDGRAMLSRLVLRQIDNVIRVQIVDAAMADHLARLGLDRLVLPVQLLALEELLVFAG